VARDLRAALALYRSAAARGLAEAEAALAGIARAGELGAANAREALALYTSAAEKGLAVAQHNLGIMLSTGEGGAPPDLAAALKWFSRAAEQGYAPSMLAVGQLIEHRSPADALQAVALFRRAADAGLAAAMLALGECLLAGRGVAPNAAEGAALVNRAAAARHPAAQFRLGQLHDQGGVLGARNTAAAAQLYAASASAGYVPALYAWGMCLLHGEGISAPDATQALQQLLAAAAKGHTLAMLQVGVCLASGVGTRADSAAAFAWFERAADAGLAAAQYNVAMMLKTGAHQSGLLGGVFQRGAPSDGVRVVENLRRAAEQGYAPAQLQLGLCYRDGLGMGLQSFALSRDKEEARRWLTLAARQGDPKAIAALREP
jgi:TPR repeat protein